MSEKNSSQESSLLAEEGVTSARASICNVLRSLIRNNIDHFGEEASSIAATALTTGSGNSFSRRFHEAFVKLGCGLDEVEPLCERIRRFGLDFDVDAQTPGNGYRSFVSVVDTCVLQCIRLCRYICLKRSSFLFRSSNYCCEVEAFADMMTSLKINLQHLELMHKWSEKGNLFPKEDHSAAELLFEAEKVDQKCFYGRCLGFQFYESLRKPLLAVSISMASFSEVYYNQSGGMLARTATSLLNCGRYVLSPEERARRVVDVAQRASVDFCKAFWLLQETEVMQQLPMIVSPQLCVNKVFTILPEPMELPKYEEDEYVDIPIPSSHIGVSSMYCRLLSAVRRDGQLSEQEAKAGTHIQIEPPSPGLLIHVHGGGFVAQSSKSHEVYLRDWARQLAVPILCIDYSLAPLAPYPRALEECLYVYCWALKNVFRLGTTADKIILMGDSAGANLIFGIAMKTIEMGIRPPDAIFAIYAPLYVNFTPSPSRLLCLMDPLLPFGFMMRCLKAYVGPQDESDSYSNDEKTEDEADSQEAIANEITLNPDSGSVSGDLMSTSPLLNAINELEGAPGSEWKEQPLTTSFLHEGSSIEPALDILQKSDENKKPVLQNIPLSEDEDAKSSSEDYVTEFVNNYVKEKGNGSSVNDNQDDDEEHVLFELPVDLGGFSSKLSSVTDKVVKGITSLLPISGKNSSTASPTASSNNGVVEEKRVLNTASYCAEEFKKFKVNQDPYLSPYLASDDILMKLPPITFLSLTLDPCLDDSVMFCKRLRSLGKDPRLIILDKLPHGFLSFSLISRDAYDGSKICVKELQRLLADDDDNAIDEQ